MQQTAQDERNRRIQTDITEDAHERLRVEAARLEVSIGALISRLAQEHLPGEVRNDA